MLAQLDGQRWLMAALLYGSGLRLMECVRLRIKDVELKRLQLVVRDGKGGKDRHTILPASLVEPLQRQMDRARILHDMDLDGGFGAVYLPFALENKYPGAAREWAWQYVFPAASRSLDPTPRTPGSHP